MDLHEIGVIHLHNLGYENTISKVTCNIAFWFSEGDGVDPLQKLFHFVLVDRRGLHAHYYNYYKCSAFIDN